MLKIKIDYWKLKELAEKSPDKFDFVRELSNGKIRAKEDFGKGYDAFEGWINSIDDLPSWMIEAASFERPETLNLLKPDGSVSARSLVDAMKMNQVHLPDNALLNLSNVFVMENACTDDVNEQLSQGFRIVAVCIQAGQRRPDYVLGRR